MRIALSAIGLSILMPVLAGAPAAAQDYPWCAQYMGEATNCGFVSYAQCMETARGAGAYCERNPMYQPWGVAAPAPRKSPRRAGG